MCKAGDATRSFRADLRIGLECAFAPLVVAKWRPPVNRYVILYLATFFVLIPIDFLFLGIVAKGFFTSEVGDMLGEIRPAPAILSYLRTWGDPGLRQRLGRRDAAIDAAVRRAIRIVLLRDVRSYVVVAAEALDLASHGRRCVLGIVRDRDVVDRRPAHRQPDRAAQLTLRHRSRLK